MIRYEKVNYLKILRWCQCTKLNLAAGAHISVLQERFEPVISGFRGTVIGKRHVCCFQLKT
jgi:hypothetical protein